MNPADSAQQLILKRLNAEADPVDAAFSHHSQLLGIGCAGIGLHREFNILRPIGKMPLHRLQEISHLIRLQHRRRTAPDKYSLDLAGRILQDCQLHLPVQGAEIIHDRLILQHIGIKIAIKTFIRAERNMNIYRFRRTSARAVCMSCHLAVLLDIDKVHNFEKGSRWRLPWNKLRY
ncbi:hypothetical protein D3C71_1422780 [compost metagenome]